MILHTTDSREPALRAWLESALGASDAADLATWFGDHYRGPAYVQAIEDVKRQTIAHGPGFLRNLVAHARKPREQREAEEQLLAWWLPRARRAAEIVSRSGEPEAWRGEYDRLVSDAETELRKLFPGRHDATYRGALVSTLRWAGTDISLDYARVVEFLMQDDSIV